MIYITFKGFIQAGVIQVSLLLFLLFLESVFNVKLTLFMFQVTYAIGAVSHGLFSMGGNE